LPSSFPELPASLKQQIIDIGKRAPELDELKEIIKGLCALSPLSKKELAMILERDPKHLQDQYLSEMVKNRELEYLYPQQPAHPKQAYKSPREG